MRTELLGSIPISGSVLERHFEVSGVGNAWVRFADETEAEWVGVFGRGDSPFSAAIPFSRDGGQTVLVIAGGQGFILDARSGALLRRTPWSHIKAAIGVPGEDLVVVADDWHMWTADRSEDHPVWRREPNIFAPGGSRPVRRLAVDGIVFDDADAAEVRGRVWEGDGWYAFQLLLQEREFRRGAFLLEE